LTRKKSVRQRTRYPYCDDGRPYKSEGEHRKTLSTDAEQEH